jgi:hypothetical protein
VSARCLLLQVDIRCGLPPTDEEFAAFGWPIDGLTTTSSSSTATTTTTALPVPTTLVDEAPAAAASPNTTTLVEKAAAASPNTATTTTSSCVYGMHPSSRCCSDSAADIPYNSCSLQHQPELADAAAADVTCRIQIASAAMAAAAKTKLPLLQTAECDTAAAMVDLAGNMQQQTKQQHSLPAAAAVQVAIGGGEVGRQQSGWMRRTRRVCSLLVVGVAGRSLRKVAGF